MLKNHINRSKYAKALLFLPCLVADYSCSFFQCLQILRREQAKKPNRTEIINYLISQAGGGEKETLYLEIGVRNPEDNFNHITANRKFSVDPGVEFKKNPVDFKMTSDTFFASLMQGDVLSPDIRFDVIFIDGLHLAEQVDRDIKNSMDYIKESGFVVLHDCNPPTRWHAREDHADMHTPAATVWNGTVWKAFLKWRQNPLVNSCCVDSDWGVGILSKSRSIGAAIKEGNAFFEFNDFSQNRKAYLNLIGFDELKAALSDSP